MEPLLILFEEKMTVKQRYAKKAVLKKKTIREWDTKAEERRGNHLWQDRGTSAGGAEESIRKGD